MTCSMTLPYGYRCGGLSASLTMMDLHAANDLNNMVHLTYKGTEPMRWPSPQCVKGILVGAESDTDSFKEDSRDEWDKKECGNWSCCPSLPIRLGPTWTEVHAVAQECEVLDRGTPTWDEMVSKPMPGSMKEEDSNWDKEDYRPTESQFEDTAMAVEVGTKDTME